MKRGRVRRLICFRNDHRKPQPRASTKAARAECSSRPLTAYVHGDSTTTAARNARNDDQHDVNNIPTLPTIIPICSHILTPYLHTLGYCNRVRQQEIRLEPIHSPIIAFVRQPAG